MSDTSIFDMDQLLTSTCDDAELAGQVVDVFITDIPVQLADLEKALEVGDLKTAERVAHSIKGASSTVGADTLRETAYTCETAAHNGDWDTIRAKLPVLKQDFTAVCDALAAVKLI